MDSSAPLEFVSVKTTLPSLPLIAQALRDAIVTDRLICRPHTEDDLAGLHALRTDSEVMTWTPVGRIDRDMEETKTKLALALPPNDVETYNFAVCLKSTGEYIGQGGCHRRKGHFGWPVIGYMFRNEFWGQGLATEFLKAFAEAYWKLPRGEYEIEVDKETLIGDGDVATELLAAVIIDENQRSQRVLEKAGFKLVRAWKEEDLRNKELQVTLLGFALPRPDVAASRSSVA